jgi:hypothetical protein
MTLTECSWSTRAAHRPSSRSTRSWLITSREARRAECEAALLAQLDRLGTNLLTLSPGQQLGGAQAYLPRDAPLRIRRIAPVTQVASIGVVSGATVERTNFIPS